MKVKIVLTEDDGRILYQVYGDALQEIRHDFDMGLGIRVADNLFLGFKWMPFVQCLSADHKPGCEVGKIRDAAYDEVDRQFKEHPKGGA